MRKAQGAGILTLLLRTNRDVTKDHDVMQIHTKSIVAGAMLLLAAGCCPPVKPKQTLVNRPEVISQNDQVARLNDRARLIVGIKARAHATLTRVDDSNKLQSDDADGSLLLRQQFGPHRSDLLLIGRYVGQDIFELGMNADVHWMAVHANQKTAWIGPRDANAEDPTAPLWADRVVELLAIEPLSSGAMAMLVHDDATSATNELYDLIGSPALGIRRVVVVDRVSGNVQEVRLYRIGGTLLASAELSDYRPIMYATDDEQAVPGARVAFPFRVVIDYPEKKTVLDLKFEAVRLLQVPAERFVVPDFAKQGLKVNRSGTMK